MVARSAVDAVLHGDREAFRILVEREAPNVVRAVVWIEAEKQTDTNRDDRQLSPAFLAPSADDPAARAIAGERSESVRRAVRSLRDPYRETLILRFFADLPLGEIAIATGRPVGTVKTHLHRGLVMLRETLGDEALP
jgi:RNA polymerase sigma factor (sigma-70 family)